MSLGRLLKDTMHLETSDLLVTPKVTQFLRTNSEGILMNKAGTAVSRESKALVAEIMDKAFAGKESALLDGLVPNDAGHALVAEAVWKATGYAGSTAGN